MPPKRNILKEHKAKVKKVATDAKKELDLSDITEELINSTTQITILKSWAKKLGVPNLIEYKLIHIAKLKAEMIKKLNEGKPAGEEAPVIAAKEEDGDIMKQYLAIEKFMKNYLTRKVTTVYGRAGDEFVEMWNKLSKDQKYMFIREYFELNTDKAKVNPVTYLKAYSEMKQDVSTVETLTKEYLKLYVKSRGEEVKTDIINDPLFSQEFLTLFNTLDKDTKLKFAGRYIRRNYTHPLNELKLFLNPVKLPEKKEFTTERINAGGVVRTYNVSNEEKKELYKNNYQKCMLVYKRSGLAIKPISLPPECTGVPLGDGYYHPTEKFFMLLCQFHSFVKSPSKSIIVVNGSEKYSAYVKKYNEGVFSNITPSELGKLILQTESGNIFVKLHPYWILNSPLYQVEKEYIDRAYWLLSKWTPLAPIFQTVISNMTIRFRTETLLSYYTSFFIAFAPFIPINTPVKYAIVDRLEHKYITPESFMSMSMDEKLPEVESKVMAVSISNYTKQISPSLIKSITHPYVKFPLMEITTRPVSLEEKCPELKEYHIRDIFVYGDKCFLITDLLDGVEGYGATKDVRQAFLDDFNTKYSHLMHAEFEKKDGAKFYFYAKVRDNNAVNVNRGLQKYSPSDLSAQFDKYFDIDRIIPDPVALITNLLSFKLDQKCTKCSQLADAPVYSMINKSDGSTVKISFCDYKCMLEHNFHPVHTLEEMVVNERKVPSMEKIAESV